NLQYERGQPRLPKGVFIIPGRDQRVVVADPQESDTRGELPQAFHRFIRMNGGSDRIFPVCSAQRCWHTDQAMPGVRLPGGRGTIESGYLILSSLLPASRFKDVVVVDDISMEGLACLHAVLCIVRLIAAPFWLDVLQDVFPELLLPCAILSISLSSHPSEGC
ncbi:MAG: hypothetical protein ACOC0P_00860, partial [Planctomycetota bacterium]